MIRLVKSFCFLLLVLTLNSCLVVDMTLEHYNGKNWKKNGFSYKVSSVEEKQFIIDIVVSYDKGEIYVTPITKYSFKNAWKLIEDTISEVSFIKKELSFPDGTILEKKSRPMRKTPSFSTTCYDKDGKEIPCLTYFYTCDDFKKKLRKYRHINLKLVYDVDSLGTVTHFEKEYELVKKRYYRFAVH